MIKAFLKNLKTNGVSITMKKSLGYFKNSFYQKIKRMPVFWFFYKLKILEKILPRSKDRTIKFLGFTVHYSDLRSLFIEYKDIFKNQIYHFHASSKSPKIIDGGGFIGISALYFKWLYPQAHIMIFEPNPTALIYLEKNILENHLENIQIFEKGLSSDAGVIQFTNDFSDGGKIDSNGKTTIQITRLSDAINEDIDFLKLNVEGSELDVLRDLDIRNKLKYIKELCIEWHFFRGKNQNLDEGLALLKKNNFYYLINHFDYTTNPYACPPFIINKNIQYYLLIYAKRNDP